MHEWTDTPPSRASALLQAGGVDQASVVVRAGVAVQAYVVGQRLCAFFMDT